MKNWRVDSWKDFPIRQQPLYRDLVKLKEVESQLRSYPHLVSYNEIDNLKKDLSLVSRRKAFLLQGGDCAESFVEFNSSNVKSFCKTMLQMTIALIYGMKKPIVKIGRIAGQYAKPRSKPMETINDISFPSYKGDIVNSIKFNEKDREADPERLIKGYFHSSATLNYLRSLTEGGYASLKNISSWNEDFIKNTQGVSNKIEKLVTKINDSISFIKNCGVNSDELASLNTAKFYTSHEALLLNYEQAFTHKFNNQYYSLSAHNLWIGDRTRIINEAHIEFIRGIENPIGIKVGPTTNIDELLKIIDILNPKNIHGKLILISRMGAEKVKIFLPNIIRKIQSEGKNVIWSCDPMHGNTIKSSTGYKTRKFDHILDEIKSFFQIHKSEKSYAGGIHFEMTGQNVTECLGGTQEISENQLKDRYHTHCDPRLNSSQSLELALLIAEELASVF